MKTIVNQPKYVTAIDIGTTKIVALVGERDSHGRIRIVGLSKVPSLGVKRGAIQNIDEAVASIQKAIEAVQIKTGLMFGDVLVGIAGQHIRSTLNRGYITRDNYDSEITKDEVDRLVKDMYKIPIEIGEEIIHVIPQSFIVDNEPGIRNPIGMAGRRLEGNFHIVIGKTATALNIQKCVGRVGLNVKGLILEQLASAHAVLSEDEKEAGVAIVDIGGGTTDLAVYYDNVVRHTAVIPFGGDVVTTDIKEGCTILHREAEELKINFGSALGDMAPDGFVTIPGINGRESKEIAVNKLSYIIQARMEEIIDIILHEIEKSGYYEKLGAGIVVTGGGAMLKHLPQLIKFRTGLDVKIGYPTENLSAENEIDTNHPIFSTSVGLILKGFEMASTEVETKKKTEYIRKAPVPEIEEFKEIPDETKTKAPNKLFDSLKKTFTTGITTMFDEKDSKM